MKQVTNLDINKLTYTVGQKGKTNWESRGGEEDSCFNQMCGDK